MVADQPSVWSPALDGADALVAMLEHAFEPFRIEGAGAGFQGDLLAERSDLPSPCVWSEMKTGRVAPPLANDTALDRPPSVSK